MDNIYFFTNQNKYVAIYVADLKEYDTKHRLHKDTYRLVRVIVGIDKDNVISSKCKLYKNDRIAFIGGREVESLLNYLSIYYTKEKFFTELNVLLEYQFVYDITAYITDNFDINLLASLFYINHTFIDDFLLKNFVNIRYTFISQETVCNISLQYNWLLRELHEDNYANEVKIYKTYPNEYFCYRPYGVSYYYYYYRSELYDNFIELGRPIAEWFDINSYLAREVDLMNISLCNDINGSLIQLNGLCLDLLTLDGLFNELLGVQYEGNYFLYSDYECFDELDFVEINNIELLNKIIKRYNYITISDTLLKKFKVDYAKVLLVKKQVDIGLSLDEQNLEVVNYKFH